MRAGRLNRRITIQQVTETQDSYNALTESWSTYKTVWAEVVPKRAREYFSQAETVSQSDIMFRIRHISGVTTKMRISYDGNVYDIQSIIEIGYKEGLEIMARLNEG